MYFIDTHSHIYYDQYKEDLSEVLDRAAEFNVEKIICVAVDIKTANECLKLTQKYTNIYMSAIWMYFNNMWINYPIISYYAIIK